MSSIWPTASATPRSGAGAAASLRRIKLLHTLVWAFFALSILAIPLLAMSGRARGAALLVGVVLVEVVVLACNGWSCPLTRVAARYTDDRRDNFDIYLPEWLARHNKRLFGALYVCGIVITVVCWAIA